MSVFVMRYNCFGLLDMCNGSDRLGQREAEESEVVAMALSLREF